MLLGHLAADAGDLAFDVRGLEPVPGDSDADRPEQYIGQLERVRVRNVETVDEAVPDEIEIRRGGGAGVTLERAQLLEHLPGLAVRLEHLLSRWIAGDRGPEPLELCGRSCRHRCGAAHEVEQFCRGKTGPVPDVREEIADRDHR